MNTHTNKINIHLGIAFDKNYLSPFYALATSIFDHNSKNKIVIHAIVTGLDEKTLNELKSYVQKNNHEIYFYTIDESILSNIVLVNKWTHAVYYRLLFPTLVPSTLDRLLYIDTDTLVLNDLLELYEHNLNNHPVGAVYDNYVINHPEIGINGTGNYFNSGVLLMDLKVWKEQKITEKAFDFLNKFPEKIVYVDQDALNAVLKDNWEKLAFKYNVLFSYIPQTLPFIQQKEFIKDKVILHFTLQRPWSCISKNRFRSLYHYYIKKSPAPEKRRYTDWGFSKIIPLMKLHMLEFYLDTPPLQKAWKKISTTKIS